MPEVIADLSRRMAIDVGALPGFGRIAFAVEPAWGDPASAMLAFAAKQESDLVVMGAESRRGLARIAHPPVAERVARHARGASVAFIPSRPRRPLSRSRATRRGSSRSLQPRISPRWGTAPFPSPTRCSRGTAASSSSVTSTNARCRRRRTPTIRPQGKLTDVDRARLVHELRALVPAQAERSWITTHVTVIDGGEAAKAILQAAERLAADAIVLGSHGRGAAYRAFPGIGVAGRRASRAPSRPRRSELKGGAS